jgi:hypothetical protein
VISAVVLQRSGLSDRGFVDVGPNVDIDRTWENIRENIKRKTERV